MKKIYLDTNIFIRFLLHDIDDQFEIARQFFEAVERKEKAGFVSILVINETIWILENYYHLKRDIYIPLLTKLVSLPQIHTVEINKNVLFSILEKMETTSIDFTDVYLWFLADKETIFSFDKDFNKLGK